MSSADEQSVHPWHALSDDRSLSMLGTDRSGLDDGEARRRLSEWGPNALPRRKRASTLQLLADQFRSVVVLLLIAAGAISLALDDRLEAGAVGVALAISTLIGFGVELRARRAMEALQTLETPEASVVRAGRLLRVDASTLVPGDVIDLSTGQAVPADARLIAATGLRAIEAPLTGEPFPARKRHDIVLAEDAALADRSNMVYMGAAVAAGAGRAVVTATGARTEVGRIGALVGGIREERTPLERRLDALGRRLVWAVLAIAAAVVGAGVVRGEPLTLMVQLGIALAVAAVPEALPAVATIALATGLHRMARRNAVVRRLAAVEALGSTTVVCTDKTRTLTSGEMTAVRLWTAGREIDLNDTRAADSSARFALEIAARASRAQPPRRFGSQAWIGDPIDAATIAAACRAGVQITTLAHDAAEPPQLLPFSSERQLMAAFVRRGDRWEVSVKGSPRRILGCSSRRLTPHGCRGLTAADRDDVVAINRRFAAEGLRVLGIATGTVDGPSESALDGLTFVGLLAFTDPPAPGVKDTIERLRRAGLRTIMVTGDQRLTAEAIGRQIGLLPPDGHVIDVHELDHIADPDLERRLQQPVAFSRITPEHKLRIVTALQARGEVVAMFGDGVNDAPALKKADVGVAMGVRGTDVAKEASAIVLQDDRFETIAAAVEEGRVIFDNIRKFVFYLFSCNVAEILVLAAASVVGLPLPLQPLQILWLNMVTDTLPALALAMEPGDADVMQRPPRHPQEAILSGPFVANVVGYGALIAACTVAAFVSGLRTSTQHAVTMCFMTLALAQILHLGNARSAAPVIHPRRAGANVFAILAAAIAIALQLASVSIAPLAQTLRVQPLSGAEWLWVAALAAAPAVAGQTLKAFGGHPAL